MVHGRCISPSLELHSTDTSGVIDSPSHMDRAIMNQFLGALPSVFVAHTIAITCRCDCARRQESRRSERPSVPLTSAGMDGDKRNDNAQDLRGGINVKVMGQALSLTNSCNIIHQIDRSKRKIKFTTKNIKDTGLALAAPSALVEQVGNSPSRISGLSTRTSY